MHSTDIEIRELERRAWQKARQELIAYLSIAEEVKREQGEPKRRFPFMWRARSSCK